MRPFHSAKSIHVLAAAVLGLTASLLAPLAPTAGATTTLCVGYEGCAEEGKGSAGYSRSNDRMYWQMYAGHNCTNYVAYRLVRKGMANERPWSGPGNATHWGDQLAGRTDRTPRVGSVAWWKAGTSRGGSSGHVAYVEKVVSPSQIVVSQDSWGGDFSWARISRSEGWPNGFIHLRDTPLRSTRTPDVSGSPRVGERLSTSRGSWRAEPDSVRYRWLVDGKAVPGADSRSLRVSRHMLGKRVQVRAVATRFGYPRSRVTSSATRPVGRGLFTTSRRPDLSGRAQVAGTLRVSPGEWSPQPDRVAYQWLADGDAIRGATSRELRLGARRVDSRIAVQVTARRRGYEPESRIVRAGDRVAPGSLRVTARPYLTGSPRRGEVLRVHRGSTSPRAAVSAVRWTRDGRRIRGAAGRTYRLGVEDLGQQVRAEVRYKRQGYVTLTSRTAATSPVKTTPRVRLTMQPRGHGVRLEVVGRAAGRALRAEVVVSHRGRVVGRATTRRGSAALRVDDLRPGRRRLHVTVRATPVTERLDLSRVVRIPR